MTKFDLASQEHPSYIFAGDVTTMPAGFTDVSDLNRYGPEFRHVSNMCAVSFNYPSTNPHISPYMVSTTLDQRGIDSGEARHYWYKCMTWPDVLEAIDTWRKRTGHEVRHSPLCLVAVSGDVSSYGMGSANEVLPFGPEHNDLVKAYLEAQLAFHMECTFHGQTPKNHKRVQKLYRALHDTWIALHEVKVFHHKWHFRTTWELAYTDELEEISRYQPFVIMTKENWQPI